MIKIEETVARTKHLKNLQKRSLAISSSSVGDVPRDDYMASRATFNATFRCGDIVAEFCMLLSTLFRVAYRCVKNCFVKHELKIGVKRKKNRLIQHHLMLSQ